MVVASGGGEPMTEAEILMKELMELIDGLGRKRITWRYVINVGLRLYRVGVINDEEFTAYMYGVHLGIKKKRSPEECPNILATLRDLLIEHIMR
jgi:hypothetical protein